MISLVAIVVGGEQIAELVKRQFLRIPQPTTDNFQFASVGKTPKHGTNARPMQSLAFLRREMKSAITDREIEFPIRAPAETVQVVSKKPGVHTEAGMNDRSFIGNAIVVSVAQSPEIGNAGEVNITIHCHHASSQTIQSSIEIRGEHG